MTNTALRSAQFVWTPYDFAGPLGALLVVRNRAKRRQTPKNRTSQGALPAQPLDQLISA